MSRNLIERYRQYENGELSQYEAEDFEHDFRQAELDYEVKGHNGRAVRSVRKKFYSKEQ